MRAWRLDLVVVFALVLGGQGTAGCSSGSRIGAGGAGKGGAAGGSDAAQAGSPVVGGAAAGGRDSGDGGAVQAAGTAGSERGAGAAAGDGGGAPDVPLDPDEVCREAVAAHCQRLDECGEGRTTCLALAQLCPDYHFGPGSSRTPQAVHACLPVLASQACTDIEIGIPPACLEPGTRPGEVACAFDSQCVSGYCESGVQQCGNCTTPLLVGTVCGGTQRPCEQGTFCNQSGICERASSVVHAAKDEPCDLFAMPTVGCAGELYCLRDLNGVGTCTPRGVVGELCGYDTVPCAHGLDCAVDYAANPSATHGACQTPRTCGGVTCAEGSYCDRIPGVVCTPLPAMGEECRQQGGPPCAQGLTCTVQPTYSSVGTCLPPGAGLGDECDVYCNFWQRCDQNNDHCTFLTAAQCPGE